MVHINHELSSNKYKNYKDINRDEAEYPKNTLSPLL